MFRCPKCGKNYKNRSSFNGHLRAHKNVDRFICEFCTYACNVGKGSPSASGPPETSHAHSSFQLSNLAGSHNLSSSSSRVSLEAENRPPHETTSGNRTVQVRVCPFRGCGKSFVRPGSYRDHVNAHKNAGTKLCMSCAAKFDTVSNLNKHSRNHHQGARDSYIQCERCEQAWFNIQWMKRHYDDCPVVRRASGSTFIRDGWTKNSQNGRYERIYESPSSSGGPSPSEPAPLPISQSSDLSHPHLPQDDQSSSPTREGSSESLQFQFWHPSSGATCEPTSSAFRSVNPLSAYSSDSTRGKQPLSTRKRTSQSLQDRPSNAEILRQRRAKHKAHFTRQSSQQGASQPETRPAAEFHSDSSFPPEIQYPDLSPNNYTHLLVPASAHPVQPSSDCAYTATRRDSILENNVPVRNHFSSEPFHSQYDSQLLPITPDHHLAVNPSSMFYPDPTQLHQDPYYQAIPKNNFGSIASNLSVPAQSATLPCTPFVHPDDPNYFTLTYHPTTYSCYQNSISKPSPTRFLRRHAVLYPDLHLI
ncbi:hypothetical protein JCM5350_000353 [Sporobolomyces pararoseus]